MNVHLEVVTRENWQDALDLKVKLAQNEFVPSAAVSLAKVYIKPDGDRVEYIPFAIYDKGTMVGFIMHAYEADTSDMYWINGFMIDEKYQGQGYGRAALSEMTKWIEKKFPQCRKIKLTVNLDNNKARKLYVDCGFMPSGKVLGGEEVLCLPVKRDK